MEPRFCNHTKRLIGAATIVALAAALVITTREIAAVASSSATINGFVLDKSGSPIKGATVIAKSIETNLTRTIQTDSAGFFLAPLLPVGPYQVRVEADGYAPSEKKLTLRVNQEARLEFSLVKEGEPPEELSDILPPVVTPDTPLLESETSSHGAVIDNKQITDLPLNGRKFVQLGALVPNVQAVAALGGAEGGTLNGPFTVAGQRDRSSNFLIDGIDNNNVIGNGIASLVSIDAIREFKIISSLPPAEFGRSAGAIVDIISQSGSNEVHGTLFEFFRNDALDATNFFERATGIPRSKFRNNQFGGAVGGPIIKDKTFYFASYEGHRLRVGSPVASNVLTEAERRGIFINPFTGTGVSLPVDPVASRILDLVPLPNAKTEFGNFISTPTIRRSDDLALLKIDHMLGGNDTVSLRGLLQQDLTETPILLIGLNLGAVVPPANIPGFGMIAKTNAYNFAANHLRIFTPSSLNEFRFGYNRFRQGYFGQDGHRPSDFGFINSENRAALPQMVIPGMTNLGNLSVLPLTSDPEVAQFTDNFVFSSGRHAFKTGAEVRRMHTDIDSSAVSNGLIVFSGEHTQLSPAADFITGQPALAIRAGGSRSAVLHSTSYNFYFQDDYRLRPNLTLNLGLRYELNTVLDDPHTSLTNFSVRNGFFSSTANRRIYNGDHNNFAPRFGLAWKPTGAKRLVLRSGYGIYYDLMLQAFALGLAQSRSAEPSGLNFGGPQGFNPGELARAFDPLLLRADIVSPSAYDENLRTAYAQHFNFNVQYEVTKDLLLSAAYVGTRGTKLLRVRDINQPVFIPGLGPDGQPLSTPRNTLLRRPTQLLGLRFPPALAIGQIIEIESAASSNYHSLNLSATKRAGQGLSLLASYTYSKSIDDATDPAGYVGNSGLPQDSNNTAAERGLSIFDTRHRFTLSYSYELPFKGNRLVRGWQLNSILTLQVGQPFTVTLGFDRSLTGALGDRPNFVPGAFINEGGKLKINRELPLDPATGFPIGLIPDPGKFGALGRNSFIGPPLANFDLSLLKNIQLDERAKLQFRAEVFNLLNTTNFAQPNNVLISPSFGRSFTTQDVAGGVPRIGSGGQRVIQFALKYIF